MYVLTAGPSVAGGPRAITSFDEHMSEIILQWEQGATEKIKLQTSLLRCRSPRVVAGRRSAAFPSTAQRSLPSRKPR